MDACYLYLLKATRLGMLTEGPTDGEAVVLGQHLDYLARLGEEGTVLLAGRTQTHDESTFGLVILRGDEPVDLVAVPQRCRHRRPDVGPRRA